MPSFMPCRLFCPRVYSSAATSASQLIAGSPSSHQLPSRRAQQKNAKINEQPKEHTRVPVSSDDTDMSAKDPEILTWQVDRRKGNHKQSGRAMRIVLKMIIDERLTYRRLLLEKALAVIKPMIPERHFVVVPRLFRLIQHGMSQNTRHRPNRKIT